MGVFFMPIQQSLANLMYALIIHDHVKGFQAQALTYSGRRADHLPSVVLVGLSTMCHNR